MEKPLWEREFGEIVAERWEAHLLIERSRHDTDHFGHSHKTRSGGSWRRMTPPGDAISKPSEGLLMRLRSVYSPQIWFLKNNVD